METKEKKGDTIDFEYNQYPDPSKVKTTFDVCPIPEFEDLGEGYKDLLEDIVQHASRLSCHCQSNAKQVADNAHTKYCLVGKAQRQLGRKVTIV